MAVQAARRPRDDVRDGLRDSVCQPRGPDAASSGGIHTGSSKVAGGEVVLLGPTAQRVVAMVGQGRRGKRQASGFEDDCYQGVCQSRMPA